MNKKKVTNILLKVLLPFLIIAFAAGMIWIHRESIREGLVTDYGIDTPYESGLKCCKDCKVAPGK